MPLTMGGPSNVTHSMVTYLYDFGVGRMRLGFGSAISVVIFIICFVVGTVAQHPKIGMLVLPKTFAPAAFSLLIASASS